MTHNDTGFDAFFRAVTSSPEFKNMFEKDTKGKYENGFKKMEEDIQNASEIMGSFQETFATKEAHDIGNSHTSQASMYRNKTQEEQEKPGSLDIEYFENKNPATWGFLGVAGMDELKKNLIENFIKPLKFQFLVQTLEREGIQENDEKSKLYKEIHDAYKKFKVSIPTGMLFYGPPGTGKTFITKKLAQELGAGLIKKSVGEFGSSYIHATSKNIRDFFTQAKKESEKGPIILFLDEIDSLVSKRTNNIDANKAEEVSQFLQEFNALDEAPNLIVIAATNRPDHLDSAILRSGRFDKKVYIGPPDFEARKELFHIFIEKEKRPSEKLDYELLAQLTQGYVPADIEAICEEAARDTSQALLDIAHTMSDEVVDYSHIKEKLDDHIITMDLLKQAIKETTPSTKFVDMSVFDQWIQEEQKEKQKEK